MGEAMGEAIEAGDGLGVALDRIASETQFSGVVRVDRGTDVAIARAYGLANRAAGIPNSIDTVFGLASGTKGFTALTVVRLIELGALQYSTTARSLLGSDLPMVDDAVTIEHLLSHRSGIGDYLDEGAGGEITDYAMTLPVHLLATTESYLPMLDGHATKFAPDAEFSYCNGGYVILALLAERATGASFFDLVEQHVSGPAGLVSTGFPRSDELPMNAAVGYLSADAARTNIFHLPVRGSGDGGIFSSVADIHALWRAVFAGEIVSLDSLAAMVRPRSATPSGKNRYGMGFWLHGSTDGVNLEGYDAGVSFRTAHRPSTGITHTVIANSSEGAWPIARHLDEVFGC
jgi:CubicO group peptidase (beta-lactamase class C family)